MARRPQRTVALLFSYFKKTNDRRLVIDNNQFAQGEIQKRIFSTMAHQKKSFADMRALFGINIQDHALIKECKAPPTYESLQTVADYLGVSLNWLLTGNAITPLDMEIAAECSVSSIVGKAENSTILQGNRVNNIIIHQHFAKVEFAECW